MTEDQKREELMRQEEKKNHFRVAVFGSARIKKNDELYKQVFNLTQEIGKHQFDIVTGGGPGIMEAASAGHELGDAEDHADAIGLTIRLPWEAQENKHLEIKKHFNKFSFRLDEFMILSNVVVVFPGGIGTTLELFYTWQLMQVKHIPPLPIILIGDMWKELVDWVGKWQLASGLIDLPDLNHVYPVKSNQEAMEIILKTYEQYKQGGNHNDYKNVL